MKNVVIIGAGGHGREVADILRHQAREGEAVAPLGFVDESAELHGREVDGLPVLGGWSWFEGARPEGLAVVCAVGTPSVCEKLTERAAALGLAFARAISPLACVSSRARLGEGVTLFPHAVVNVGAVLGDYAILNLGATVSHDTDVGPCCNVNPGARLAGNVRVGAGCYVGMGAQVIQGVSVGAGATIGAGAVVIRDLPAGCTAVGVPARVIKEAEPQGARHMVYSE